MKIEKVQPVPDISLEKGKSPNKNIRKEDNSPAAIYEKSEPVKKVTYDKSHEIDRETINRLIADSNKAYSYLKDLVEALLKRQGKTFNDIKIGDAVEIDEEAKLEATKLIDENGPLSPEAVSNRIVDFAKAISGGDIEKLDELKKAIDKGFKEAEKILGELPSISNETYKLIMEKLDNWAEEVSTHIE
mgnify:CR=1 FL=1